MATRRSFSIRGIKRVRRIFKELPDVYVGELVELFRKSGNSIATTMRARAPRRTGALHAGIESKVYPRSLRLRVGLLSKRRAPFYGRFQDLGVKAQVVQVQRRKRGVGKRVVRGRKLAGDIAGTYRLRVKAQPAKRFVTGQFSDARKQITTRVQEIYDRALKAIRSGGIE